MQFVEYANALKLGHKVEKAELAAGNSPYLPALDEILKNVEIVSEVPLGILELPLDMIVGTKTAGRQNAFTKGFLPIMPYNSEFAMKWENVMRYQNTNGIADPIAVYEYLNEYYVLEGNKRVSVLKYINAISIEGNVTRLVPKYCDVPRIRLYYEFLDFYRLTGIHYLVFSKEGSYRQLLSVLGREDEKWTEEECQDFRSVYVRFSGIFSDMGGKKLGLETADAFLFYLTLYSFRELNDKSKTEIQKELGLIWKELKVFREEPDQALVMEPSSEPEKSILTKILSPATGRTLRAAYVYLRSEDNSSWTYSHEFGRALVESSFRDAIETSRYVVEGSGMDELSVIEQAIKEGNDIIFTAHQKLLGASLKAALEHPETKILNCSLNRPFNSLRTYYGRMYEAKFLCGMVAGAMAEDDRIAYFGDYPIFGSIANVNAFALGAKMVNPRAKVYLHWRSVKNQEELRQQLLREAIPLVSDPDMIRPCSNNRLYGLHTEKNGIKMNLACPIWDWGKFYEKMIRDIREGNWKRSKDSRGRKALNYYWGISGGIIDIILSNHVPVELKTLVNLIKDQIRTEQFHPFTGPVRAQNGVVYGSEGQILSVEEIITMNWLVDNVVGSIPEEDELNDEAAALVHLQKTVVPEGGLR